jgi:uncharacterized protein (TIGR00369 family)
MTDTSAVQLRIAESFARQDFMQTLGAELLSVSPGAVAIGLAIRPGLLQQHGFVHAGVVSAIADTAAGYAALSLQPAGSDVLTAEFTIHLLAPARGERLVARARVVRAGRRLTVSACDVFAVAGGAESCVATLLGSIVHRTRD